MISYLPLLGCEQILEFEAYYTAIYSNNVLLDMGLVIDNLKQKHLPLQTLDNS